jgi:hypothetical protein
LLIPGIHLTGKMRKLGSYFLERNWNLVACGCPTIIVDLPLTEIQTCLAI